MMPGSKPDHKSPEVNVDPLRDAVGGPAPTQACYKATPALPWNRLAEGRHPGHGRVMLVHRNTPAPLVGKQQVT